MATEQDETYAISGIVNLAWVLSSQFYKDIGPSRLTNARQRIQNLIESLASYQRTYLTEPATSQGEPVFYLDSVCITGKELIEAIQNGNNFNVSVGYKIPPPSFVEPVIECHAPWHRLGPNRPRNCPVCGVRC